MGEGCSGVGGGWHLFFFFSKKNLFKLFYIFVFSVKVRLGIACELSALQMNNMKY